MSSRRGDSIEAVVASDDRVERHFLEVKSALDLTTKKDQAKLAKFILGAANRMPDQAGKAFEGYGVMVLGAAEGSAIGMPQIEALEIHKAVLPFIGADGPGYDLVRVPCTESDNEILVFLVDPPEWGQGPFICRKSGDGQLRDGAVFVRADGETREARADELRQLIQRGQAATTEVDFAVRVVGVVRPVKLDDERTLEEFISHHRCRLHAALNQAKSTPNLDVTTGDPATAIAQSVATLARQAHLSMHMFTEPESRDEDDYLASIDDWAVHVRAAWPEVVLRLIGALADPVEVEVTNHEKTFFRDVELKVHLEGNVLGVACRESRDALDYEDLGMPSPPRAWGPKTSKFGNRASTAAPTFRQATVVGRCAGPFADQLAELRLGRLGVLCRSVAPQGGRCLGRGKPCALHRRRVRELGTWNLGNHRARSPRRLLGKP